ncbi:MAG: 50S ribosomal protein L7Ae [DPANN group archaeon]|nr:50S ribosomal protein L7Ae [DPANN group archaeon]
MAEGLAEQAFQAIEKARDSGKIKRGVNEATKALERGTAKLIVVADDTQPPEIIAHLPLLSKEKNTPFVNVPTKKELGSAAGIGVPTSAVAIIDEGQAKDLIKEIASKQGEKEKA